MNRLPFALAALSIAACSSASEPGEAIGESSSALSYEQTQDLVAGDATASVLWGSTVVAHDGVLAVPDTIEKAIYVYERQGAQWTRAAKLVPPADDTTTTLELGNAVAVTGTNVFAKHCTTGDFALGRRCHVDVFAKSGGTWPYVERVIGDPSAYEKFAMALAADGDLLVAGASLDMAGGIGSAYVFAKSGGSYGRVQKLVPASAGRSLDAYGQTLALSGKTLLVGSLAESSAAGSEGAIYHYSNVGTEWRLDARLVVPAGDGLTLCLAGDVIAASSGFNANIDILRNGVAEAPLAAGAAHNSVACDGARVGVGSSGDTNLRIYSPSGTTWSENDLPLGGTPRGIAMSDGAIFVGISDSPPKVRVLTYGTLNGEACADATACAGGFCVDGVCCESACGGGSTNDCQACSRAAGSRADGTCSPVDPTHVCRAAAGVCDVADHCDGTGTMCPADLVAANGSSCSGTGTCNAGACSVNEDGTPAPSADPAAPAATEEGSGGCASGGRAMGGNALPAALAVLVVAARRRKRRREESGTLGG